jgi:hypothetical protein
MLYESFKAMIFSSNYIIRIYRFEKDKPHSLVGVAEEVGTKGKKAFNTYDELWEILNYPKDRQQRKINKVERKDFVKDLKSMTALRKVNHCHGWEAVQPRKSWDGDLLQIVLVPGVKMGKFVPNVGDSA